MSRSRRLIPCRTALALAAAAAIGPWAPIPAVAATCSWNTTSGNWATAGNWINCNGTVPSSSDIANIGSSGVVTVDSAQAAGSVGNAGAIQIDAFTLSITGGAGGGNSLNSGTITAGSLSATGSLIVSNTALGNTGGTIGVVGSGSFLDLISSSITGGTLSTSSGGLIRTDSSNVTFSGLSLSSGTQVAVQDNSVLNLVGTITNAGTISILAGASTTDVRIAGGDVLLTGGGTLNLAGVNARVVALNGSWRLTNDTQQTIQGFGQLGSSQTLLTNQGLIDANSSGNVLWVQVEQGSSANTGTMQASGGGVLHIDNSAIANGSGVIQALDSPGSTSWVALSNTTIVGGTLTTTGNGTIHSLGGTSNVLANVTNTGNLLVDDNSALRLSGTMTNQGTIGVGAGGSTTDLRLAGGDVLLTGSGTVTLSSSGAGTARVVAENGAWRLTNDTQQTIQGFGQLGAGQTLLTNKGLIDANSNGNMLLVQVEQASSANPGTM